MTGEKRSGDRVLEGINEEKWRRVVGVKKRGFELGEMKGIINGGRPVHRTIHEQNIVWRMLKKIPLLSSQLSDEQLKILSRNVVSETWTKGSIVIGDDGLYIILKGLARPQVKVLRSLTDDEDSVISSISRESLVFDAQLKDSTVAEIYLPSPQLVLKKWSTFGSLEVMSETEMDKTLRSVVTEEDCEILKIPAKEFEKLKLLKSERASLKSSVSTVLHPSSPSLHTSTAARRLTVGTKLAMMKAGGSIARVSSLSCLVLVESGTVISFVGFINSGYCNIYRNVVGLMSLRLNKMKKVKKLVYMGKLREKQSFGEISILLQDPFTCTIITGGEVEMMVIEDEDILALDPVTKELMIQTAKPTFGHLTEEDVKNEYIQKVREREWKYFKVILNFRSQPSQQTTQKDS
ncbi:hypothetical protein ACRRTK_021615 [Alexandromys fortis]